MEENKLEENQAPQELLKSFDIDELKKSRVTDVRLVAGFLMRISKKDSEALQKIIKQMFPNASLFYIKMYPSNESLYLVSKSELEDARVEKNRAEIEERSLIK